MVLTKQLISAQNVAVRHSFIFTNATIIHGIQQSRIIGLSTAITTCEQIAQVYAPAM